MPSERPSILPKVQLGIAILWPSFLAAVVATGLFFSAFDPEFFLPISFIDDLSVLGIYTIGFILFWILTALSGLGTLYFALSNLNVPPRKIIVDHDE